MTGTQQPEHMSTQQQRIAQLGQQHPERSFISLAHHMDMAWMYEAWRRTRKNGAVGVDGQTAAEYQQDLENNLRNLLDRAKSRLIDKWLKAGVLEDGQLSHPQNGTPQGGVILPLMANIYLHEVLDQWFADSVQPRLKGRNFMVRYADDAVLYLSSQSDAARVWTSCPNALPDMAYACIR